MNKLLFSKNSDFMCGISYDLPENPCILPECHHLFDAVQIEQWKQYSNEPTCPMCRKKIVGKSILIPSLTIIMASYKFAETLAADLQVYQPKDEERSMHNLTLFLMNQPYANLPPERDQKLEDAFQQWINDASLLDVEETIKAYVLSISNAGSIKKRTHYIKLCYSKAPSQDLRICFNQFMNALKNLYFD